MYNLHDCTNEVYRYLEEYCTCTCILTIVLYSNLLSSCTLAPLPVDFVKLSRPTMYDLVIFIVNTSFHRSLESSLNDSKPVAIQLRMLEVFTSHESFHNAGNRKDAAMVTVYLTRNGKGGYKIDFFLQNNGSLYCMCTCIHIPFNINIQKLGSMINQ